MSRHRRGGAINSARFVILLGLLAAVPAWADVKIGFIDSDRIFSQYAKTKEAQDAFNREVQDLANTARDMKVEIDKLQHKLDSQGPMLSEAKREEQAKALQDKISAYEAFVQKNWGPSGDVSRLNEQFLRPILDRVNRIVTTIAQDEGYSLVLDAAGGHVVFGDKALDLTDRVLGALRDEDAGLAPPSGRAGATAQQQQQQNPPPQNGGLPPQ